MTINADFVSLLTAIGVVVGVVFAVYRLGPEKAALSSESLKAGTEILSKALDQQRKELDQATDERKYLDAQVQEQAKQIAVLQGKTDVTPILIAIEKQGAMLGDIAKALATLVERIPKNGAA